MPVSDANTLPSLAHTQGGVRDTPAALGGATPSAETRTPARDIPLLPPQRAVLHSQGAVLDFEIAVPQVANRRGSNEVHRSPEE